MAEILAERRRKRRQRMCEQRVSACAGQCALDGARKARSETVWVKPLGAIDDPPGPVEHNDRRESLDAQKLIQPVGEDHCHSNLLTLEVGLDAALVLIVVDGQEENVAAILELTLHLFEQRLQLAARQTPGGPEVPHDDLAFPVRKLHRSGTVGSPQDEFKSRGGALVVPT